MRKLVTGFDVDTMNPVDIMWMTTPSEPPIISHFVPLVGLSSAECVSGTQDTVQLDVASDDAGKADVDSNNKDDSQPPQTRQALDGHFNV